MESISPSDLALELLNYCLRGSSWPSDLLETLLRCASHPDEERAVEASNAFFRIVIERLADLFEPALCDTSAALLAAAVEFVDPDVDAADLVARYRRVRCPHRFEGDPSRVRAVYVLSRVTLGADVAVTSVMLEAARRRFPNAEIHLAGPRKCWELFAADASIRHLSVPYPRAASLRERLAVWSPIRDALNRPDAIVIDPDSRLTQLGLLPVCPEENYYFFESRGWGGYDHEPLSTLASNWVAQTFDVDGVAPFLAPAAALPSFKTPPVAVSFGVGENPAKRVDDPFEEELLRELMRRDFTVLIDKGAGGEEAGRVERAIACSGARPGRILAWDGSFAAFAEAISRSRLYIGYDSAGQHVAAASGVPLVSVFAGFVSPRMFSRWRPSGPGPIEVVPVESPDPAKALADTLAALDRLPVPVG